MPKEKTRIATTGLIKRFDGKNALDGVDLEVRDGEILTLIGPSGSGKTLLLKTILGLVTPDAGEIEVGGEAVLSLSGAERDEYLKQFGILFQRSGLFDGMPVWENIGFRLLQKSGASRKEVREAAIEKLRAVGLSPDVCDLYPAELSGGMQKRVGIARALAGDPSILFLDEPTAGLDPIMSNVINDLILQNVRDLGSTVIAVTSNLVTARRISDRIAMLHEGRVVWCGDVDAVEQSDNPYLDQFWHKRKDGPIQMPVSSLTF
ncbi:ABC transporter ATP-binding protein [Sneathiella chinensis]|uniref:ABC transporter ATP-binding protein n=1 Tax=Sneathiella chinensis TaxID=349750 RepID=A0ABQ5U1Y3_9PROT|nr:ATP-binding cassette domain-containing protein [Sneathiella chinensis]GLQ06180.1 ABC transporter ATP-binding protein [Sneathiella chinensis]